VRTEQLVDRLELDLTSSGVCLPCLTLVAFPLDSGDERRARREARRLAPELWADGLELTTVLALETARRDGVEGAGEALDDVKRLGHRSVVVEAIVWRLAEQMVEDIRRRALTRQSEAPIR
jgi:hypothetical protein